MVERLKPKTQDPDHTFDESTLSGMVSNMVDDRLKKEYSPTQQGFGQTYPQTVTQEMIEFFNSLEPDIPERLRKILWGLLSVQNQLTQINSPFEQRRLEAGFRAALECLVWEGEITASEMAQIEVIIRRQMLKSKGGIERRLLAPQITEQKSTETILDESRKQTSLLSKLLGRGD